MSERLKGKVAIITGGVSGMGLAACELFVAEGARVVVADIQREKGAALESRFDGKVAFAKCDIRNEKEIEAAVNLALTRFGGLDTMFHNAGATGDVTALDKIGVEGWDDTQNLLLRSTMLCVKHSIEPMKKRGGGSIILTSSAAAVALGGSGPYAYTVAKAGMITLGRYAALQLGEHFIRVNVIVPGGFATSIWSGHVGGDAAMGDRMPLDLSHFARMQPIPRAGKVEDIAEAALYLASDVSSFVTGVTLPVDGGLTLHRRAEATAAGQLGNVQQAVEKIRQ